SHVGSSCPPASMARSGTAPRGRRAEGPRGAAGRRERAAAVLCAAAWVAARWPVEPAAFVCGPAAPRSKAAVGVLAPRLPDTPKAAHAVALLCSGCLPAGAQVGGHRSGRPDPHPLRQAADGRASFAAVAVSDRVAVWQPLAGFSVAAVAIGFVLWRYRAAGEARDRRLDK
ncbi:unnamed protein product, partial [Prorocentrum cordatum]